MSQRWVLWVPTVDEVAEVVVSVLDRNAVSSCCLVGHSYGTAVASRLLQQAPHRIQQLCLIDPVCFTMFMPNLLRNFLYESPRSGSFVGDFMMMSAARDLHVSATLSRRFFWSGESTWSLGSTDCVFRYGLVTKHSRVVLDNILNQCAGCTWCGLTTRKAWLAVAHHDSNVNRWSLFLLVLCADVNLWEEQLPPDTLVVLSGRDALMAAPQVGV